MPKEFDYNPESRLGDLLRPETHEEILNTCVHLSNGPTSRAMRVGDFVSYIDAIAQRKISPDTVDVRMDTYRPDVSPELEIQEYSVEVVTFGESYSFTNEKLNGARDIAEVDVYLGPDHNAHYGIEHGRIFVEVGVDNSQNVTYTYVDFKHGADDEVFGDLLEIYTPWGIPLPEEASPMDANPVSGILTETEGRVFLNQLRRLRKE